MKKEGEELQELGHEEVPGYRKVFYAVMAAATIYLAMILINTL